MTDLVTDVAIFLKESFGPVLGIGALITIARGVLINVLVVPHKVSDASKGHSSLNIAVRKRRVTAWLLFGAIMVCIGAASYLYLGPLQQLNPPNLRGGITRLTDYGICCVVGAYAAGIAAICFQIWSEVHKQSLLALVERHSK